MADSGGYFDGKLTGLAVNGAALHHRALVALIVRKR
jgi:hypothetical protein